MTQDAYVIHAPIILSTERRSTQRMRSAVQEVVKDEYNRMVNYVRTKMSDTAEHSAEDVVQDVLYKCINRPDFAAPIENVVTYLYQSIRNRIVDIFRKRKENVSLDKTIDDESTTSLSDLIADWNYSPDLHLNKKQLSTILSEALEILSDQDRILVIAVEMQGYTFQELADTWDVSINTLLSRKSRAIKKMKLWFENKKIKSYQEVHDE